METFVLHFKGTIITLSKDQDKKKSSPHTDKSKANTTSQNVESETYAALGSQVAELKEKLRATQDILDQARVERNCGVLSLFLCPFQTFGLTMRILRLNSLG